MGLHVTLLQTIIKWHNSLSFSFIEENNWKSHFLSLYIETLWCKLRLFELTKFIVLNFYSFNPLKAGGSESMYSLGGASHAPPLEKGLRE